MKTKKPVKKSKSVKPSKPVKVKVQEPKNKHTREEAVEIMLRLRKRTAEWYAEAKRCSAALMVPATDIDNATFYIASGEFDRAVEICTNRLANL